jgi:dephospho-CoA kinase
MGRSKKNMKLKANIKTIPSQNRLHQLSIPIIGLTGGIASGKSTVSKHLEAMGLPLISADQLVKTIYGWSESLEFVKKEFPDAVEKGQIQFSILRQKVFQDKRIKELVESFIYQRLPKAFNEALMTFKDPQLVVYDVPLLFERKLEQFFDLKILVYAPREVQLKRLMERDGINSELANSILDQQMDIELKKTQSDFIIDNSKDEKNLAEEIKHFVRQTLE